MFALHPSNSVNLNLLSDSYPVCSSSSSFSCLLGTSSRTITGVCFNVLNSINCDMLRVETLRIHQNGLEEWLSKREIMQRKTVRTPARKRVNLTVLNRTFCLYFMHIKSYSDVGQCPPESVKALSSHQCGRSACFSNFQL
uniref:Uncharacterized protein n=1 Tax=Micrurus carvalhoi TaxID=3147026 RepID=A0A2H6MZM0_9SAUR